MEEREEIKKMINDISEIWPILNKNGERSPMDIQKILTFLIAFHFKCHLSKENLEKAINVLSEDVGTFYDALDKIIKRAEERMSNGGGANIADDAEITLSEI